MTHGRALLFFAMLTSLFVAGTASAQATVQGQIIITEVPQSGPTVPPGYATPAPQSQVVVAQAPQMQLQCPPDSTPSTDRWGRPTCMHEVTRHRAIGGLIGGGIGLLAGGYVASVFTTLFSGLIGAFHTGPDYTVQDLDNYVTFGFIPILGPWVQLGFVPPFADDGLYAWIVVEGLLQAGGLTMLIFGILGEEYTDFEPIAGVDVHLAPMLGTTTQGLSATMTF